jgi:hypothetical protein
MAIPSNRADLVIVGTGSLAEKVVQTFSQLELGRLRVAVIGRAKVKLAQMALIANARAAISNVSTTFAPVEIPEFNAGAFSKAFRSLKPKIIFHAASLQSPWESAQGKTAWTRLIANGGFGITLPLQLGLIAQVSHAAADSNAAIVNASYPDCVNVVLDRVGIRVTCGIGNSAIVEAFGRAHPLVANADVRVVGHHGHLSGWLKGMASASLPRIWVKSREVKGLRLSPKLSAIGEELNDVTASTAVTIIRAQLTGETVKISIPGVPGFPGGYPFALRNRKFALRLPPGINLQKAMAHNKTGEVADGLDIGGGVQFTARASHALTSVGFEYAEGFDFAEWSRARDAMLRLRERLRSQPPAESSVQSS